MKKGLKKAIAATVASVIFLSLAGCGASPAEASKSGTETTAKKETKAASEADGASEEGKSEASKGKIGYNYFAAGDYALDTLANNTSHVIEACGYEAMGVCDNGSLDQLVTDVENMIASGCDGLVLWIPNDSLYLSVAELCEKAGVPFVLADKVPTDQAITDKLATYKTYCGATTPDNYSYGVQMAEFAIEQGYETCFILASGVGDASGTPRIEGFTDTFEKAGGKVLGTQHTDDSNQAVTQAEDMYLAHTDADFIMATGASTFGSAALETFKKYNDKNMKIITADFDEKILSSMKDEDYVQFLIGDFLVCGSYASALMCNKLNGTPMLNEDGTAPYVDMVPAFSIPVEEMDLFNTYIAGDCIYSDKECQAMLGMSLKDFEDNIVTAYSLEDRLNAKYQEGTISADEMKAAGLE